MKSHPDGHDGRPAPVYAVIAAAGSGSRMAMPQNKQFLLLGGMPVIRRTILAFENCEQVAGILVVSAADQIPAMQNLLAGAGKILGVTAGGPSRQESVWRGLQALIGLAGPTDGCPVLVHDGARCFVSQAVINRVIDGIRRHQACGAAVPVKDTIKQANPDRLVVETPDRSRLWAMQTPQGATFAKLYQAYAQAASRNLQATDDLGLLEQAGNPVYLADGDYLNIKITTPDDLLLGEWLARQTDREISPYKL